VYDEGMFENVSITDDVQYEERDVGASLSLQIEQDLQFWCNIQNEEECAELKDKHGLSF
jgi:hypothetical protein